MKHPPRSPPEGGARSPPGPRRGRPDSAEQRPEPPTAAATQTRRATQTRHPAPGGCPRRRRSASRQHRRGKSTPLTLLGRRGGKKNKTAHGSDTTELLAKAPRPSAPSRRQLLVFFFHKYLVEQLVAMPQPLPDTHLSPVSAGGGGTPPTAPPRPQRGSPLLRGGGRRADPRPRGPAPGGAR